MRNNNDYDWLVFVTDYEFLALIMPFILIMSIFFGCVEAIKSIENERPKSKEEAQEIVKDFQEMLSAYNHTIQEQNELKKLNKL